MEDIYQGVCGIIGGPHIWILHALDWSPFYFWWLTWRAHLWRDALLILGVDHILSCGALHLLNIQHIHPWICLPWDSHMQIGCMHLVDFLVFLSKIVMEQFSKRIIICFTLSYILEGTVSEFSQVELGAHPPIWRNILFYFARMHSWREYSMWTLGI